MEYLLLIAYDESTLPEYGTEAMEASSAAWIDFSHSLMESGHFIAGAALQPTATATTAHKPYGADFAVVDGPYAETKEQLGGFYLIKAADLDEALVIARRMPIPAGSVEVRPISYRPDAAPVPTE